MRLRIKPVLQTWGRTLRGQVPSLSLEITSECPLRCPGCYAYEDAHLGTTNLRSLSDFKGRELIARILALMDQYKPLHLSIVGGDPLVRYRDHCFERHHAGPRWQPLDRLHLQPRDRESRFHNGEGD